VRAFFCLHPGVAFFNSDHPNINRLKKEKPRFRGSLEQKTTPTRVGLRPYAVWAPTNAQGGSSEDSNLQSHRLFIKLPNAVLFYEGNNPCLTT
jgi:hypothetical protein